MESDSAEEISNQEDRMKIGELRRVRLPHFEEVWLLVLNYDKKSELWECLEFLPTTTNIWQVKHWWTEHGIETAAMRSELSR